MAKRRRIDDLEETLTESEKSYIRTVHSDDTLSWDERMSILRNKFGIAERTARRWIKKLGYSHFSPTESEHFQQARLRTTDKEKKYYIITWAQNATPPHLSFWNNLKAYAGFLDASIHVIAGKYLNPIKEDWWDEELVPYLDANRHQIHPYVTVLSDIKVLATASNPLSGFQGISGNNTTIIGHPRIHLESLPVLEGYPPKLMLTTGACTIKNYSDSKAGAKGIFHHTLGAVIVEIKDDLTYYIRQITATKEGTFTDLFWEVKNAEIKRLNTASAFVMGDLHWRNMHRPVFDKTIQYLKFIKPNRVVLHDLFDGSSISHHELKDPIKQFEKYNSRQNLLHEEMEECVDGIEELIHWKPIVIWSNHSIWVDRYILDRDWKKDIPNALTYMKYAQALLEGKAPDGILAYKIKERYGDKVTCLGSDDSFRINSWEVGSHGHMGANGARGNIESYRKLSTKIIIGDKHCIPAEYEVQTKQYGWRQIDRIKRGDIILTYNPETGRNEWNEVEETNEYNHSGLMLRIQGNGFSQKFTPEHRLMMKNGDYIPATEAICTRSSSELPITALPISSQGISVPDKIVRQIVAIAADGHMTKWGVRFDLKKKRKIERLKLLFGNSLDIENENEFRLRASVKVGSNSFFEIFKYKENVIENKRLSKEILDWDVKSIETLEDELKHWDGTFDTGHSGRQWSSTCYVEKDIVLSVLSRLGLSCSLSVRRYKNKKHATKYIVTWSVDRQVHRNSSLMNHSSRLKGWGFSSYHTNGVLVYCVNVPNRCFWIKSNKGGPVSLTGNSPSRKDNVICVGTYTKLRLGYNKGASSWMWVGAIIHEDSKVQHIIFFEGENGKVDFTTLWNKL